VCVWVCVCVVGEGGGTRGKWREQTCQIWWQHDRLSL